MNDAANTRLIPTQRFGLSTGIAAFVTFIFVSITEPFGKDISLGACLAAPLVTGFLSGLIFGNREGQGVMKSALVGMLGLLMFYVLILLLSLSGIAISVVFVLFFYFIVLIFPLGLLMSALGGVLGKLVAHVAER